MGMSTRQAWTITEASQRCGVSKSTVRRYREDGKFPNAWKDGSKPPQWRIPLEDLLAVGWKPVDTSEIPPEKPVDTPSERVRELEGLLALERAKREAAERIAVMAERNADDLRRAMAMLEASPVSKPEHIPEVAPEPAPTAPVGTAEAPPRKRRWWSF
jgi:hypothetical protein